MRIYFRCMQGQKKQQLAQQQFLFVSMESWLNANERGLSHYQYYHRWVLFTRGFIEPVAGLQSSLVVVGAACTNTCVA